ncbi:MAG: MlaD family protein [Alphaproteobacteria bacterium]|nr:MlaD family protein [Alphaproteobacteria bacterium]
MADKKKKSAKLIGTFVVGGIVLFLAGLIAFSSSSLFSRRVEFVMYFDSSLKGLDIGSPVSFRGVQIGHVTNIVMEIDRERKKVLTPVYVVIEPEKFKGKGLTDQISLLAEPPIKSMVEKGLRAQLQSQSLITGQMNVELEFRPSFPARYRKDEPGGVDEIPTIPSQFDRVQGAVETILESFRKLELQKLADTTVGTMETAHAAAYEFYTLLHKLNARIDPILANVDGASEEGRKALVELQKTLKELNVSADKATAMFAAIDKEVASVSPALNKGVENARTAFDEVATAMRAMRELADYLERNPDALLTGKQQNRR